SPCACSLAPLCVLPLLASSSTRRPAMRLVLAGLVLTDCREMTSPRQRDAFRIAGRQRPSVYDRPEISQLLVHGGKIDATFERYGDGLVFSRPVRRFKCVPQSRANVVE